MERPGDPLGRLRFDQFVHAGPDQGLYANQRENGIIGTLTSVMNAE